MCKVLENYFDGKYIRADLFSDVAEKVVDCIEKVEDDDYDKNKYGYKCEGIKEILPDGKEIYYGKKEYRKDCPEDNIKIKKNISSTQIRKFYEEVLNLKERLDNGKDFKEILPYFKMLKAKANVAYQRDVINTNFKRFIEENVDYVGDDEKKFRVFCTFFEAVVAYAKGKIRD